MSEPKFCSECKYARVHETKEGFLISCKRHKNPTNAQAAKWKSTCSVFRKFTAQACTYYEIAEECR